MQPTSSQSPTKGGTQTYYGFSSDRYVSAGGNISKKHNASLPLNPAVGCSFLSTVRIIVAKARHSSVAFSSRWRSLTPVIGMKRYTRMLGRGENFPRMASDSIHCEILRRAAEIAGGEDKLAQHLDVRPEDMHEWVQAKATAPAGIYIIALDTLSRGPQR
jgi:hypothetical protein